MAVSRGQGAKIARTLSLPKEIEAPVNPRVAEAFELIGGIPGDGKGSRRLLAWTMNMLSARDEWQMGRIRRRPH